MSSNDLPAAQEALWEMLVRRAVELLPLGLGDLPRIRELLRTSETSRSTGLMVGSVLQSSLDPRTLITHRLSPAFNSLSTVFRAARSETARILFRASGPLCF